MFRDFAPKMDPCLGILLQKKAIFKKIFRNFLKNGPMFRDFGAKNGTHVKGFFCQKQTNLGGTSPYSVSMGVPPRVGYNSDLIGYTLCVFVNVWVGVEILSYEIDVDVPAGVRNGGRRSV